MACSWCFSRTWPPPGPCAWRSRPPAWSAASSPPEPPGCRSGPRPWLFGRWASPLTPARASPDSPRSLEDGTTRERSTHKAHLLHIYYTSIHNRLEAAFLRLHKLHHYNVWVSTQRWVSESWVTARLLMQWPFAWHQKTVSDQSDFLILPLWIRNHLRIFSRLCYGISNFSPEKRAIQVSWGFFFFLFFNFLIHRSNISTALLFSVVQY